MAEKRRRRGGEELPELMEQESEASPVRDLEDAYAETRSRISDLFDLPEDFVAHMRAARREVLLAVRSLIDARIESLEESDKRREAGRRSRVNIE